MVFVFHLLNLLIFFKRYILTLKIAVFAYWIKTYIYIYLFCYYKKNVYAIVFKTSFLLFILSSILTCFAFLCLNGNLKKTNNNKTFFFLHNFYSFLSLNVESIGFVRKLNFLFSTDLYILDEHDLIVIRQLSVGEYVSLWVL